MKKIGILSVILFLSTVAMSQNADLQLNATAGDNFRNTTYQLDWSIGEVVTETYTAGNRNLTQGFHQSSYEVSSINKVVTENENIKVFPNPTTDLISVEYQAPQNRDVLIVT